MGLERSLVNLGRRIEGPASMELAWVAAVSRRSDDVGFQGQLGTDSGALGKYAKLAIRQVWGR